GLGRSSVVKGVDHLRQLPGARIVAQRRERHRGPDRPMGVLATILPHTRHVAANVSGLEIGSIERRIEKLDQRVVATNQARADRVHRSPRACGIPRPRKYRPALGDRIDLTLGVGDRTQRRAVVEVRAPVPLAIPAALLDLLAQLHRFPIATVGERRVIAQTRHLGKFAQNVTEKKAEPYALALAVPTDKVHAVVPIARPDQWQAMDAEPQAM